MGTCGSCGGRSGARSIDRRAMLPPARRRGSGDALLAGSARTFTVLTARGVETNRRFSTLIGAQNYANRIGGTVKAI